MFSVVIPAYNCERTIYDTIESVLHQSRFDLVEEIIVVNDGSTDNTRCIVEGIIIDHPEANIVLKNQTNAGVSKSRNNGIIAAKGEWIALLDSDDIWLENKISRQEEEIRKHKDMVFLGSAYPLEIYLKKITEGLCQLTPEQLCFRYTPSTPSVVFKKSVGLEFGLFDETMKYGEDINFFQRFLSKNSYYVLAEDLIRISIGKQFYGETGLSSNLREMHRGRNKNTVLMYKDGMISLPYMVLMLAFNQLKFLRRSLLVSASKLSANNNKRGNGKFSIIMVAYNCEKSLARALNSVKAQTKRELIEEIVVIDDGSSDHTADVLNAYIEENREIAINVIYQTKHGVSFSRNVGIKKAKGEWIALLEANDVWEPNKLEQQERSLRERTAAF